MVVSIPQSTEIQHFSKPSELTPAILSYCQPYSQSYAGIDSFLPPSSFFQITVGKTHAIEVEGLRRFYHITTPPRRLYFVVPEDVYHGYYKVPQALKQSGKQAKLDTADWRTRIEQWVLCMDFTGHN